MSRDDRRGGPLKPRAGAALRLEPPPTLPSDALPKPGGPECHEFGRTVRPGRLPTRGPATPESRTPAHDSSYTGSSTVGEGHLRYEVEMQERPPEFHNGRGEKMRYGELEGARLAEKSRIVTHHFTDGISAAVVASLPDFTRSYSSFTQGIVAAFRSIQSGMGVRRFCLSSCANSTTTSSRV